ncbi:MAG TPA: hypothetical protein VFF06_07920 [Polyangia bacterium]|nr:hypothetical protein [Polyangia bacterium]
MTRARVTPGALAAALLGLAFLAFAGFCVATGVSGGSFGAATRAEHPGAFWFFIAAQVAMGIGFLSAAIRPLRRARRWLLAVVLALGVWMAIDLGGALYASVMAIATPDRWAMLGLAALMIVVLIVLGYQLLWLEIKEPPRDDEE